MNMTVLRDWFINNLCIYLRGRVHLREDYIGLPLWGTVFRIRLLSNKRDLKSTEII